MEKYNFEPNKLLDFLSLESIDPFLNFQVKINQEERNLKIETLLCVSLNDSMGPIVIEPNKKSRKQIRRTKSKSKVGALVEGLNKVGIASGSAFLANAEDKGINN